MHIHAASMHVHARMQSTLLYGWTVPSWDSENFRLQLELYRVIVTFSANMIILCNCFNHVCNITYVYA